MKKIFTLCIVHQDQKVLLGMKKIKFGKGKWNGFGGHVEAGETIEDAARREMKEESGVEVEDLEKIGITNFRFMNVPDQEEGEVHIFRSTRFSGTPTESNEMIPKWFDISEIPYEHMWLDDAYWLPLFLKGQKFIGTFIYDGYDRIDSYELVDKTSL